MPYPIDVAVMTCNSARYLDPVLAAIFKAVKVKRLIIVDHYSEDDTIKIAKEYGAEIHFEDVSLAYARQLAISLVETPIFMFLDSDLLFLPPYNWFEPVMRKLERDPHLASIVMRVSEIGYAVPRGQYNDFWNTKVPFTFVIGFTTGSTFIKTEAVAECQIPPILDAREDRYLELHILNKKQLRIDYIKCKGIHYFDHAAKKGAWSGANERILEGLKIFPYVFFRRIITAPLKAIPPMLYYRNPEILTWNTKHWLGYLKGFLNPYPHRKLERLKK